MSTDEKNTNMPALRAVKSTETNPQGYPLYPVKDDIYEQSKEEVNLDPEDISKLKTPNSNGSKNEKAFEEDVSGNDLDIPGAELDDDDEMIGSEDEENNHYSLGGDPMNDPEADNGE